MLMISRMMRDFDRAIALENEDPMSYSIGESIVRLLWDLAAICVGLGIGSLILMNLPFAAALSYPAAIAVGVGPAIASLASMEWLMAKSNIRDKSSDREFDGMRIVGSRKDIGMVVSSVRAVQALTSNFNASAELPPRVGRKIAGFVDDMAQATSRIAVFSKDQSGSYNIAEDRYILRRQVLGANGDYFFSELAQLKTNKIS